MTASIFKSRDHSERLHTSAKLLGFKLPYAPKRSIAPKPNWCRGKRRAGDCYHARDCVARLGADGRFGQDAMTCTSRSPLGSLGRLLRRQDEGHAPDDCAVAPARAGHRAVQFEGGGPLHDLHALASTRRRIAAFNDALMIDWRGQIAEGTGANIFFVQRRRDPHADAGLLPQRHHAPDRHQAGARARHRSRRARHLAERAWRAFSEVFLTGSAAEITPSRKSPACNTSRPP
jgi:branched-chain amino acid aminotransferase